MTFPDSPRPTHHSPDGQFRTPDPMSDAFPGWNAYAYVLNDPMGFLDPTGLSPCGVDDKDICELPEVVVTADRYDPPSVWTPDLLTFSLGPMLPNVIIPRGYFEMGMDLAGTADPTGLVDLGAAVYYVARGDALNAGISLASILPAGDLLKAGRVVAKGAVKGAPKLLNQFNSVESLIDAAGQFSTVRGAQQAFIKGDGVAIL